MRARARVLLIKQKKRYNSHRLSFVFVSRFWLVYSNSNSKSFCTSTSGECFICFISFVLIRLIENKMGTRKHPKENGKTEKQLFVRCTSAFRTQTINHPVERRLATVDASRWSSGTPNARVMPEMIWCSRDELFLIDFNWIIVGFALPFFILFFSFWLSPTHGTD